jgi:hypothetical protein
MVVRRGNQTQMTVDDFPFALTEETKRYCNRIAEAMTTFCGLDRRESVRMIREFWADIEDLDADPLFFNEPPYYYAMAIAHHPSIGDNRPNWYNDRNLWPPPPGWCLE